jgi:DNA-binding CsgD family transcriptional regulator
LYALFLITINFAFSHYDGFCNFIITPTTRYFTHSISHFIVTITGVLFATEFLNLHRYIPKSKKTGATLLAASLFIYSLHLYTNEQVYYVIANFIAFATLFYYWILGFKTLDKNRFSKFFVIGYSLLLFSGIFYILPMGLGISTISISLQNLKLAAVFEMLVLTYAITYRVQMMKEENENIRNEIQNYLKQTYNLEEKIESHSKVDKNESLISKIEKLKTAHDLTTREVDVLICLSKGYTNQKISEELFVSLNTVKYHTRNIYQKLNIKTKNEAVSLLIT